MVDACVDPTAFVYKDAWSWLADTDLIIVRTLPKSCFERLEFLCIIEKTKGRNEAAAIAVKPVRYG